MPSTLILYASVEGHTERIAQRDRGGACAAGPCVDVVPAGGKLDLVALCRRDRRRLGSLRAPPRLACDVPSNANATAGSLARKSAFFREPRREGALRDQVPSQGRMAAAAHRRVSRGAPVQQDTARSSGGSCRRSPPSAATTPIRPATTTTRTGRRWSASPPPSPRWLLELRRLDVGLGAESHASPGTRCGARAW